MLGDQGSVIARLPPHLYCYVALDPHPPKGLK